MFSDRPIYADLYETVIQHVNQFYEIRLNVDIAKIRISQISRKSGFPGFPGIPEIPKIPIFKESGIRKMTTSRMTIMCNVQWQCVYSVRLLCKKCIFVFSRFTILTDDSPRSYFLGFGGHFFTTVKKPCFGVFYVFFMCFLMFFNVINNILVGLTGSRL